MRSVRTSSAGRSIIPLLVLVASGCTDAVAPASRPAPTPSRPLAAIAPATIVDLGWGGTASLRSHFALDVNFQLDAAGASENETSGRLLAVWQNGSVGDLIPTYGGSIDTSESVTNAIANDRGMAGHYVGNAGFTRGIVYPAGLGGIWVSDTRRSVAYDINSNSATARYVGWIEQSVGSGVSRAFHRGVAEAAETLIPTLPGGTFNVATGINENQVMVGYSQTATGAIVAFLYGFGDASPLPLNPLVGGTSSIAWGLNNATAPIVVGYSNNAAGEVRAVMWQNGVVTAIPGNLGGANSVALDVNNNGDVVGYAMDAAGNWKPFVFRPGNPSMEALVLETRSTWGAATGISDRVGARSFVRIVGYAESPNGVDRTRPVYWDIQNGAPYTP